MKRRWAVFLCCIVGFTLFGCGADNASPELTIAYIGDVNLLDNHLLENAQMVFKKLWCCDRRQRGNLWNCQQFILNDALASIGMINGYDKAVFTCLNGMDEKSFGVIDDAIVVSNTSRHKEEAYQFIQTILSYNVQVSSGSSYCWSPSICKDAWSESISSGLLGMYR